MIVDKDLMNEALTAEVSDRRTTYEEGNEENKALYEEICALNELGVKVEAEQPLTYQEYEWLCYVVGNYMATED